MSFLGERPELPDDLVQYLHERAAAFRPVNWGVISEAAYSLYEQWKKV
jgi:lipopolysaccharide/colanic/teichoic acid biosynthesis glycosyltransferase